MIFVAGEDEAPVNAFGRHEPLEQRGRELYVLSAGTPRHHKPHHAAIVIQILLRRNLELKFVTVHNQAFTAANKTPVEKCQTGFQSDEPGAGRTTAARAAAG
jgi:hypothetical protein